MFSFTGVDDLHRIVVLNPKGGCGKTTLATNVASLYAVHGAAGTLVDCDPQGFCMRWLEKRPADRPPIHGLEVHRAVLETSEPLVPEVSHDSGAMIFDLPAGIPHERLHAYTQIADSVLLPITPSAIDVYSATRFIAELLLDAQLDRRQQKLAIVANRVRSRTRSYQMLLRFLTTLRIPLIATLRDSQNFVHAAANGIGVCEMPAHRTATDMAQLSALAAWLERPRAIRGPEEHATTEHLGGHAESPGFGDTKPLASTSVTAPREGS